jgi:hypothetical protein
MHAGYRRHLEECFFSQLQALDPGYASELSARERSYKVDAPTRLKEKLLHTVIEPGDDPWLVRRGLVTGHCAQIRVLLPGGSSGSNSTASAFIHRATVSSENCAIAPGYKHSTAAQQVHSTCPVRH